MSTILVKLIYKKIYNIDNNIYKLLETQRTSKIQHAH